MAVLRIKDDEGERTLTLDRPMMTAGRSSENEIVIKSNQSSRRHFQIEKVDAGFKLVDLESRNGTKVNGKFVNQHLLTHGDKISIGTVELDFDDPDTTARTAPVDSPGGMQQVAVGQMRERSLSEQAAEQRAASPRPRRPGSTVSTMDPEEREILVAKQKENKLIKGVAIGAGVLVGAIILLVVGNELTKVHPAVKEGESHYREAERLKDSDPGVAMEHLRKIKPEAGQWYRLAQVMMEELRPKIHDQQIDPNSPHHKAFEELSTFCQVHPDKYDEILSRLSAFESQFKDQLTQRYINYIEGERGRVQRAKAAVRTRDLDGLRARVDEFKTARRWADAMKELVVMRTKYVDPETRAEIDAAINALMTEAQSYFNDEDHKAQDLHQAGNDNEAQAIYEQLLQEFTTSGTSTETEFNDIRKAIRARLGIGE